MKKIDWKEEACIAYNTFSGIREDYLVWTHETKVGVVLRISSKGGKYLLTIHDYIIDISRSNWFCLEMSTHKSFELAEKNIGKQLQKICTRYSRAMSELDIAPHIMGASFKYR